VAGDMREETRSRWRRWFLLIVLLPIAAAALVLWLTGAVLLLSAVWLTWIPRRRYAVVVYSNSPVWQDYFEREVIPRLGDRAIVLNWSGRRHWPLSMAVMLVRMFGGSREYNPMAMVFEPLRWPRHFRFYRAFRSFKNGDPAEVEKLRSEFFRVLDALARPRNNVTAG
jgi:hypothetical protein